MSPYDFEKDTLKAVNKDLCKELAEISCQLQSSKKKCTTLQHKMYSKHCNNMKKLRRRDVVYKAKRKEVTDGEKMAQQLVNADSQICTLRRTIDRYRHRAVYWRSKCHAVKQSCDEEVIEIMTNDKMMKTKLKEEVEQLQQENIDLCDTVDEIMMSNKDIITYQQGKYTDDIRACCYELLSLNVGVCSVKAVINSVLTNIMHKTVDCLPCCTTLCDMMVECLTVAQAQLGEKLSREDENYFTIQTDGTTKFGEHFETYDAIYHLGVHQVFSGSAQTTLDT